jgi:TATA-box binding protein (TBP) (component of TFIID and TFIIIB)
MTTTKTVKTCEDLVFPDFNDIKVSTKTIIAMTNMTLNIRKLFYLLPVTDYVVVPKRRGRKKKVEKIDPNKDIPSGSIITLQYENNIRGVDLKKKKSADCETQKPKKYFRNSLTVVMVIDSKNVNFKTSRNGKFQMTGCKTDEQAENCLKYLWQYCLDIQSGGFELDSTEELNPLEKDTIPLYEFTHSDHLYIMFIPAMRNIDFSLGFLVDREKLSQHINLMTQNHSWLEASFGYTGVNIKFPMIDDLTMLDIKQLSYKKEKWSDEMIPFTDYLDQLPLKEQEKKLNKDRHNTFLVFHSGKTIMSGMTAQFMENTYYEFLDIIRGCYDKIEERLEV